MIGNIISYLKQRDIHTPRLAIARFLLAFGMLLTMCSNKMSVIANHNYTHMHGFAIRHAPGKTNAFGIADLYLHLPEAVANAAVILILLLVMSGFWPKVTGLLHFLACFSYHNYYIILNGGDDLTLNLSLLLVPICLTDPRSNQWLPSQHSISASNIFSNIAMFALQMVAAWVYFDAFYPKLFTPQWADGTAIFYYTSHYRLGAPNWLRSVDQLFTTNFMVKILSWGTLLLEFLLAVALLLPTKIKRRLFLPALVFHFLIVVHLGLITFFIAIAGMLLLYLDDDDYYTNRILRRFVKSKSRHVY